MPPLRLLAGPDGEDPLCRPAPLGDPCDGASRRPAGADHRARLAAADQPRAACRPGTRRRAVRVARSHRRTPSTGWAARRMIEPYLAILSGGGSLHDILRAEGSDVGWRATVSRGGEHIRATKVLLLGEPLSARVPAMRTGAAMAAGLGFAREFVSTIGDAVVLHPPAPTVAPRHGRSIGRMDCCSRWDCSTWPDCRSPRYRSGWNGRPATRRMSPPAQAGTTPRSGRAGAGTRLRRMGLRRLVSGRRRPVIRCTRSLADLGPATYCLRRDFSVHASVPASFPADPPRTALRAAGCLSRSVKDETPANLLDKLAARRRPVARYRRLRPDRAAAARAGTARRARRRTAGRARPGQDPPSCAPSPCCSTSDRRVIDGAELPEHPLAPITPASKRRAAELGDELPVRWVHRSERTPRSWPRRTRRSVTWSVTSTR